MEPMPRFRLHRPASVAEVLDLRREAPAAPLVAGGTDLVPNIRRGIVAPETVIDIAGVAELKTLEVDAEGATVGAGVTLAALTAHPDIRKAWPAVAAGAEAVAGPTHREAATVGGNLCLDTRCVYYNQSEWWRGANDYCLKERGTKCHVAPKSKVCFAAFSGDLAPACLVADAEVRLAGRGGDRSIPLADLYTQPEDGAAHLALEPGEFVVSMRMSRPAAGTVADYAKARVRGSIDFPLAGVAVALRREGEALAALRVALTGTNSRPLPVAGTDDLCGRAPDDALLKELERLLAKQMQPMRSTFTPQTYRRRVAINLARRLVTGLFERAG